MNIIAKVLTGIALGFLALPAVAQADDPAATYARAVDFLFHEAERAGDGAALISGYAMPIVRVSEKLPVQQLLDMFIKHKAHLFLVEDEFGQTSGIVTLEDAIETMLGREILDESDTVEDMQELARGKYRDRLRTDRGAGEKNK